jgi:hydroxymethylbilane synthase
MPAGSVIASSSTRRKAQLLTLNSGLSVPPIRGNVATRLQKLAKQPDIDATILAHAGMRRLNFRVAQDGAIQGEGVPDGLRAVLLTLEEMLPCVGQGAVGIEVREQDPEIAELCDALNHSDTFQCVTAERAFLAGMGGGCQSPVAAYAEIANDRVRMRALSFASGPVRRAAADSPAAEAAKLGAQLASALRG